MKNSNVVRKADPFFWNYHSALLWGLETWPLFIEQNHLIILFVFLTLFVFLGLFLDVGQFAWPASAHLIILCQCSLSYPQFAWFRVLSLRRELKTTMRRMEYTLILSKINNAMITISWWDCTTQFFSCFLILFCDNFRSALPRTSA